MSTKTTLPTSDDRSAISASAVANEAVSVVIPCYNEEKFIGKALEQLAGQYDSERYEIIVVDGMSTDATRARIQQFQLDHPKLSLQLVDNPARSIPAALNIGVSAARGEIIARMDAHAVPSRGYIRRCVEVLNETTAGVVGMPCRVQPGSSTLMAKAIAQAVSHPFGIGDAKYRLQQGESLQESVDTVAFACFRKSLWGELGGFNESLHTNEDYEFNYRVKLSGKDVLLDRSGHCDYFARTTLRALAAQYSRYGRWKAEMVLMQPRSIKVRHLVAPLFVLSIVSLLVLGFAWFLAWSLLALILIAYFCGAVLAGIHAAVKAGGGIGMALLMPIIFTTIHLTWGTSFLLRLMGLRQRN